ncbi:MAG: AAA family ATPase [Clostridiales bacterium]|nr:AAA family ATPase [Clostridiales bacterium]
MLKFTSMTIINFGPYEGEQTIDFGDGEGVTLIWGDNGRGKTTLLNLFRYALFGRFQYRHDTVEDILKLVNKEGLKAGKYDFKVILRMIHDGKSYELTRQYSVRQGVTKPTKSDDYVQDVFLKVDGHFVPNKEHELAMIMPEDVSRFFLFDGELLQEYEELVKDETSAGDKIKKSIESILGVPILTNSATDTDFVLGEYRKEQTKAAQANKQTEKYAAQIESETAKKEEQEKELARLQAEEEEIQNLRAKLEDEGKQHEHLRTLIQNMEHQESDIATMEATRDALLQQIVVATKDVWRYVIGQQTSEILRQVKAELSSLQTKHDAHESATRLMNYMQHIVETHHCECCDQDVDETHVTALKKRLDEDPGEFAGLSSEEVERMKTLQIRQASLESMQSATDTQALKIYEDQLADLLVRIDDAKGHLKDLRDDISRYGDVSDLAASAKENAQNLAKCYSKIDNLKDGIQATKEKIKEADIALASLEEKVRKAGTSDEDLNLAIKKVKICASLHELFNDGIAAYRDKLKAEVEHDATELFCSISSDSDYTALRINDNYGLSIEHRSGEIVPFRSAGFEHIVALSLIGALHKNAPLSGPIIMDSPFGRLDPTHKKNITKALPLMSDQIILLAYTDEIDGQTARQVLGSNLKKEYRLRKYSSFHTEIELQ